MRITDSCTTYHVEDGSLELVTKDERAEAAPALDKGEETKEAGATW
jgi:hypothetical protein